MLGNGRYRLVWFAAAGCTGLTALLVLTLPETRPPTDEPHACWLPPRGALLPGLILFLALLGFGGFNSFAALYARRSTSSGPDSSLRCSGSS